MDDPIYDFKILKGSYNSVWHITLRLVFKVADVAEWLRRLTRNQIPSGSVGSSPTDRDNFYYFFQKKEVLDGFSDKKGS